MTTSVRAHTVQPFASDQQVSRARKRRILDDVLPEYDFRGGMRGTYAAQFAAGTNLVLLDPDLARIFPSSEAVNRALRKLLAMGFDPAEDV